MTRRLFILLVLILSGGSLFAQTVTEAHYRIFRPDGTTATLDDIVQEMANVSVVLVGEQHNDPVAHYIEATLFERAHGAYGATRPVTLSLEMFERDAQTVLDEYLAGLIREQDFLKAARPWNNYETDYRPMVEFAKENGLAVIAANAPRRYVSRVGREGPSGLDGLSHQAKQWLPPLPFPPASPVYRQKFQKLMADMMRDMQRNMAEQRAARGDSTALKALEENPDQFTGAGHGNDNSLSAQALWDASMAHAITQHLVRHADALVLHMCGSFHAENHLGTSEKITHYRPGTEQLTVIVVSDERFPNFDVEAFGALGDFIILADPSLPRTYETDF